MPDSARPVAVYQLFDADGHAVYVGAAVNPDARIAWHRAFQPWWGEVDPTRTIVNTYATAWDAMQVERERIAALQPRRNRAGVTTPYVPYPSTRPTTEPELPDGPLRDIQAELAAADAERAEIIEYRDRQILAARAAGHTWASLEALTGLSTRGLQIAIRRAQGLNKSGE